MKRIFSGRGRILLAVVLSALVLSGCSTRSISQSGGRGGNAFYSGELKDSDVLGAAPKSKAISDDDIQKALSSARQDFRLPKSSSILLIQSGAMTPDVEMQQALAQHYSVALYSGIPPDSGYRYGQTTDNAASVDYPRLLRLTAANDGQDKILVFWGQLESGSENEATKVVSWVPFVGGVLPDETQHMRIVLRIALIDVASGRWTTFTPPVFENSSLSGRYNRDSKDAKQIMELKSQAYQAAAEEIYKRFTQ